MQMRTTLHIDGDKLRESARLSGIRSKTAVIDAALREMLDRLRREKLKGAWGKIAVDLEAGPPAGKGGR